MHVRGSRPALPAGQSPCKGASGDALGPPLCPLSARPLLRGPAAAATRIKKKAACTSRVPVDPPTLSGQWRKPHTPARAAPTAGQTGAHAGAAGGAVSRGAATGGATGAAARSRRRGPPRPSRARAARPLRHRAPARVSPSPHAGHWGVLAVRGVGPPNQRVLCVGMSRRLTVCDWGPQHSGA